MRRPLPFSDDQLTAVFAAMDRVPIRWRGNLMLAVVDQLKDAESVTDEKVERAIAVVLDLVGVSGEGDSPG